MYSKAFIRAKLMASIVAHFLLNFWLCKRLNMLIDLVGASCLVLKCYIFMHSSHLGFGEPNSAQFYVLRRIAVRLNFPGQSLFRVRGKSSLRAL